MLSEKPTVKRPPPSSVDTCFLDFDGCMYPGISKIEVARCALLDLAVHPRSFSDRMLLVRLFLASGRLIGARLVQKLAGRYTDGELVRMYLRWLEPIPASTIATAVQHIPARLVPGTIETFEWLARRMSVNVVSLALHEVLEAVDRHLRETTGLAFSGLRGNRLHAAFLDQGFGPVLTAEDKVQHMRALLSASGSTRPLVIGHDLEDIGMAELARELSGFSIGVNPEKRAAGSFDACLFTSDWTGFPELLSRFFPAIQSHP
jgi:phosphoserine phosphatase